MRLLRSRTPRAPWEVQSRAQRTAGSILVGVLWCIALLAWVVAGVLHTARLDLRIVKNYGDLVQAHYLALAGIEKAKALLYHDAEERRGSAVHHTGRLYDAPEEFRDIQLGRGQFRVFRQAAEGEATGIIYGISDEESRLNFNHASLIELTNVHGMTPDVAAAIVDYRDENSSPTEAGAEAEYYSALQPPYLPRNGPLRTTRELLMVRGISREVLLSEDANQNGLLDPEENDGDASLPADNQDGMLDAGWSGILTVESAARNITAKGEQRVDLQSAAESELALVPGVSPDLAKAIVAHRGRNRFESIADLLDVTAPAPQRSQAQSAPPQQTPQPQPSPNATPTVRSSPAGRTGPAVSSPSPAPSPGGRPPNPSGQPSPSAPREPQGPKLVTEDQLLEMADALTTESSETLNGAVNINTASVAVLRCVPGIDQELAHAIVAFRQSNGFFQNVAWLLRVPGMTRDKFKQAIRRVTVRSETFRILSEGYLPSTGARKRLQAIVRVADYSVDTLSYREDL